MPQELLLMAMLAGMGIQQLPKVLKGLSAGQGAPGGGGGVSPQAIQAVLPLLSQLMGGAQPPPPVVPRFPAASVSPVVPRLAGMAFPGSDIVR